MTKQTLSMHPIQQAIAEMTPYDIAIDKQSNVVGLVLDFIADGFTLVKHESRQSLKPGSKTELASETRYVFANREEKILCFLESVPLYESVRIIHMDEKKPTEFCYNRHQILTPPNVPQWYYGRRHHTEVGDYDQRLGIMKEYRYLFE